jgi:hypothetical protein
MPTGDSNVPSQPFVLTPALRGRDLGRGERHGSAQGSRYAAVG